MTYFQSLTTRVRYWKQTFHFSLAFISTWLGGILGSNGQYMLLWILGGVLSAAAALLCYTIKEEA